MDKSLVLSFMAGIALSLFPSSGSAFDKDTITTSIGKVEISFIGHGTLMLQFDGMTIHVDPYGRLSDYNALPKADLILITHHHGDHLDAQAVGRIRTDSTIILLTQACASTLEGGTVMKNGDTRKVGRVTVEAVPAYNIIHKRSDGSPYHPNGEGNGYVLTFGTARVYVAGDTENTPEMKALKQIDYAFLPMNLPYTMTPEMVADAAKAFRPKVLYPYHYGSTDPQKLVGLLKDEKGITVRIRSME